MEYIQVTRDNIESEHICGSITKLMGFRIPHDGVKFFL